MKKFYIHYNHEAQRDREGQTVPPKPKSIMKDHTSIFKASESVATVANALISFANSYNEKFNPSSLVHSASFTLHINGVSAADPKSPSLPLSSSFSSIDNQSDLYVIFTDETQPKTKQEQGPATATAIDEAAALLSSSSISAFNTPQPPSPPSPPPTLPTSPLPPPSLRKAISKATALFAKKQYKQASEVCNTVLKTDDCNIYSLRLLGQMNYKNKKYDLSAKYFVKVVGLKNDNGEALTLNSDDFAWCAKCFTHLGDDATALNLLESALESERSGDEIYSVDDIIVCMATCLRNCGRFQEAAGMIETVIKKNDSHCDALIQYACIAAAMNKHEDSISLLLRCIVIDQSNPVVKEMLAGAVQRPGGMEAVKKSLPLDPATAPAYAFLSSVVRDFGAIKEAAELTFLCISSSGGGGVASSYALQHVHALELTTEYQQAFDYTVQFLKDRTEKSTSDDKLQFSVEPICLALAEERSVLGENSATLEEGKKSSSRVKWVLENKANKNRCHATVDGSTPIVTASKQILFNNESLDMLALLYTLVKICYVCGNMQILPALVKLIEPIRLLSKVELHMTTIRNENAYYCCVSQLLASKPAPYPSSVHKASLLSASNDIIYIVGDSHSLSPAWKTLKINGVERLLVPKIVTGLKHWHLRKEGKFYPKVNFYNVMSTIPDGSDVIFIFGEIDCREGILLAVQKDIYRSLESGMQFCIDIWMKEAGEVMKSKNLNSFIHPIVPVLDETRTIVINYNVLFKKAVDDDGVEGTVGAKMVWIDIFEELLAAKSHSERIRDVAAGKNNSSLNSNYILRKEYDLDGTHLHPAYLGTMERWFCRYGVKK